MSQAFFLFSVSSCALSLSVGPPYMLEKDDWLKLVTAWTQFVPK
jgi:hypothetical protein